MPRGMRGPSHEPSASKALYLFDLWIQSRRWLSRFPFYRWVIEVYGVRLWPRVDQLARDRAGTRTLAFGIRT